WLFIFLAGLVSLLKDRRKVMIHAGQILETGVAALVLSRLFAVPYVVHVYGEEINHYAKRGFTKRLMRRVLAGASAVTSISHYTSARLKELGLHLGPVELVRPAVDTERFAGRGGQEARASLGLGANALVLLTVSRLMKRKGHDTVLRALPQVLQRHPEVVYLIGGEGTQETRLRKMTQELGLEAQVRFLGSVAPEQLEGLYSAADLFVHPNREVDGDIEGFGMVFLEASACSVPVVGGNSGGTPDAVQDGISGFLVDPDDVADLTRAILRLLEDAALRRGAGAAGPAWARQFTWEKAAGQIQALTRKAFDRR
ncbi:unnamed protein product, partial [Phaeothamnion confervicola]